MNRILRHGTVRRSAAVLGVIAGTALLATSPAGAIEINEAGERQITVDYRDLDISRPEGAEVLLARIELAAEQACGVVSLREGARRYHDARRCMKAAVETAVRRVRDERLDGLHDS